MIQTPSQYSDSDRKIILFPALLESRPETLIHFAFSIKQVEGIRKNVRIFPVPFSPDYILGIAQWNNKVLPVLCLEKALGLKPLQTGTVRYAVVRTPLEDAFFAPGEETTVCGMIRVSPFSRISPVPEDCIPDASHPAMVRSELIRGWYRFKGCRIGVMNLAPLLKP